MIAVTVTAPKLPPISEPNMAALISDLADGARAHWVQMAQETFHTTAQDYVQGIQPVRLESRQASIDLVSGDTGRASLVKMLEIGAPSYDLKIGLLRGKDTNTVPFRHGTPGTSRMIPMPKDIYGAMKKAAFNQRIEQTKKGPAAIEAHPPTTSRTGYQRGASIYSGMQKLGKQGSARYQTFRSVSKKSPTESWMHPGFEAKNLAEKVGKRVEEDFAAIAARYEK